MRPATLLAKYDALAAAGSIERDPAQLAALERLERLAQELSRRSKVESRVSLFSFLARRAPLPPPRGLYLWGAVGRGKTTLMDLFYAALPMAEKRRAHFHAFMADVHGRLHRMRQAGDCPRDPVTCVGEELAQEIRVLCFDEFSVSDIADATILGRLFATLFAAGVVVVATSNVEPARLYEGGRNRDLFLPFIALLRERMDAIEVAARTDFRLEKQALSQVWFAPADIEAHAAMDALFHSLTGATHGAPLTLEVKRRHVFVPQAAAGVARFTFADICGRPLGAGDYMALAGRFHTMMIDEVPALDYERRNEARRFITLVDVLYEARRRLVVSATCEAADIYRATQGAEAREFPRTVSRLIEMRSAEWLEDAEARV